MKQVSVNHAGVGLVVAAVVAAAVAVAATGRVASGQRSPDGGVSPGGAAVHPDARDAGQRGPVQAITGNGGGEDCASATVIPALPFVDSGTTSGKINNYQPQGCSFAGPAGDVVYAYTPADDQCVDIELCASSYDTSLMVYADICPVEFACNDDFCNLQSQLSDLNLTGGVTYYIVVDGFDSSEGAFTLSVAPCPGPCDLLCPPGALHENEPDCGNAGDDTVNGGCNVDPPVFSPISPGDTYCGTAEWDTGIQLRDTDWYKLVLTEDSTVTWTVEPEFDASIGVINNFGVDQCFGVDFLVFDFATRCSQTSISACFPAGTWYLWVGADFRGPGFLCGPDYVVSVSTEPAPDGCPVPPCPSSCPASGSCVENNGTPGCHDRDCCCAVCAFDSFCCDVAWDGICALAAEAICPPPPTGACCIEETGACLDGVEQEICVFNMLGQWGGDGSACATLDPPCQRSGIVCATSDECDDDDACTFDRCPADGYCQNIPARYGDIAGLSGVCAPDGVVDLLDVTAALDGFRHRFGQQCTVTNIDIAGLAGDCTPNGAIDIFDIFAVLDAFQGIDPCCAP